MDNDEYMRIADLPPDEFRREAFALANVACFNAYVEMRIRGYPEYDAFTKSFPEIVTRDVNNSLIFGRATSVEHNPYTIGRFKKRLADIETRELWSDKVAINELLQLVRDKMVKDAVRLGAVKELNVLLDITVTDEAGRTRRNKSLDNFYDQHGVPASAQNKDGVASGDTTDNPVQPQPK